MTATDELRRMLDERGVEHFDATECTLWGHEQTSDSTGCYRYAADEVGEGFMTLRMHHITPEQAIAATLGSDLQAENMKLRELVRDMVLNIGGCALHGNPLRLREFGNRAKELGVDA